ncbi:MAG: single-stranded DNA-binding protein [Eubacteriales bacterium]
MASFNKVILMGRLTAAPELKMTSSGLPVTSFTLAVDRKYQKDVEKKADFPTVVAWRQTAEFICKYFGKGSAIIICGELQTRSWTDDVGKKRYATEVVASEVSFAESKKSSEAAAAPEAYEPGEFVTVDPDEDLPF